jgi:hypothetical protein
MKTPRKHHTVDIVTTQHTVIINKAQIDILYLFDSNTILIFVDGEIVQEAKFHPSRLVINYINLIEVAEHIYELWMRKKKAHEKSNPYHTSVPESSSPL